MAKAAFRVNLWTFGLLGALASFSFLVGSPAHAAIFDVKSYGAKGDGVADDSGAIQAAINAAGKSSGNTVFFPDGNYLIDDTQSVATIEVAQSMILQGSLNTFLFIKGAKQHIHVTANQAVTVEAMIIENAGSNRNSGVVFDSAKNGSIKNCTFTGWTNGVAVRNASTVSVDQITVYAPKRQTGVLVQKNSTVTITNSNFNSKAPTFGYGVFSDATNNSITLKNNHFDALGYSVFVVGNGLSNAVGSIKSSNNTFDNCYYGYDCDSLNSLTIDSETINNATYGVYAHSTKTVQVTNCKIKAPSTYGIYADNSQNVITVSTNTITNLTGADGIYVGGSASVKGNVITGKSESAVGIYVGNALGGGPGNSNVDVSGNTISGVLYGVESSATDSLNVANNNISKTSACGIYLYGDTVDTVNQNDLKDCAQSLSSSYAVIYVNGIKFGNGNYKVTNNKYTAKSTPNLKYFIYVYGAHVSLSGNTTNTMLPSYP